MFLFCFYVPEQQVEDVKNAAFLAGGGRIGDYESCAWQVKGQGQFKPLSGSRPFIGEQGVVEQVEEFRVEMVVEESRILDVVKAMKEAHPYEEPAYHVLRTLDY